MISVSPVTVNRWLDGKFEPRHKHLLRIEQALDISNGYFSEVA